MFKKLATERYAKLSTQLGSVTQNQSKICSILEQAAQHPGGFLVHFQALGQ